MDQDLVDRVTARLDPADHPCHAPTRKFHAPHEYPQGHLPRVADLVELVEDQPQRVENLLSAAIWIPSTPCQSGPAGSLERSSRPRRKCRTEHGQASSTVVSVFFPFGPSRLAPLLRPQLTSRSASASPFQTQGEISPSKDAVLHRTTAGFTSPEPWPSRLRGPLPARRRLGSGCCTSAHGFTPRFLPTLGRPHAVAVRFDPDALLSAGLASARHRPCWAQNESALRILTQRALFFQDSRSLELTEPTSLRVDVPRRVVLECIHRSRVAPVWWRGETNRHVLR